MVFSHRFHRYSQMFPRGCSSLCCTNQAEMYCPQNTLRRVWHPCHTHATHLIILPQIAQMFRLRNIVPRNTQNTQKFSSARKFCEFCGSTFQQEVSVCSVNSVGRCSGSLVGAVAAWLVQWQLGWCTSCSGKRQSRAETSAPPGTALPGRLRGYGRMPYPPISAPLEEISSLTR